jgi:hypothetical protein
MADHNCAEYKQLQKEVETHLTKITELTTSQLRAFQLNDQITFARLDKELENAMGEKERRIGAARQHAKEHGCQGVPHTD